MIRIGNTFYDTPENNWRNKIDIEIGDSKQTDFFPQIKLMRWDNEANISVRLNSPIDGSTVVESDGTIIWERGPVTARFYKLPADLINTDGAFEFDIVLNQKPPRNYVEFTLVDKDVEYLYQPPLTQEQIDIGYYQPENVIGSYAIYAKTPKINYQGQKQYKTGKICHIYRPKITDSANNEVWGNISITNGVLRLTVPQQFIDNAIYPIVVDPTFGITSSGANYADMSGDDMFGTSAAPASDGSIDSISAYTAASSGTVKAVMVLHSTHNILTDGVGGTSSQDTTPNWRTMSYSSKPSVTSSTTYDICVIASASFRLYWDFTGSSPWGFNDLTNNYSSPTNPTDGDHTTWSTTQFSIYATYSSGSTTSTSSSTSTSSTSTSFSTSTSSTSTSFSTSTSSTSTSFSTSTSSTSTSFSTSTSTTTLPVVVNLKTDVLNISFSSFTSTSTTSSTSTSTSTSSTSTSQSTSSTSTSFSTSSTSTSQSTSTSSTSTSYSTSSTSTSQSTSTSSTSTSFSTSSTSTSQSTSTSTSTTTIPATCVIDQSQTNENSSWTFGNTFDEKQGQTFQPSITAKLCNFQVRLALQGTPTDSVKLEIYSDSSGVPGSLLATADNNADAAGLTADMLTINFPFTNGPLLSIDTTYWAVVSRTGSLSSQRYKIATYFDDVTPDYTRGDDYTYDSFNEQWNVNGPEDDWFFREYYDNTTIVTTTSTSSSTSSTSSSTSTSSTSTSSSTSQSTSTSSTSTSTTQSLTTSTSSTSSSTSTSSTSTSYSTSTSSTSQSTSTSSTSTSQSTSTSSTSTSYSTSTSSTSTSQSTSTSSTSTSQSTSTSSTSTSQSTSTSSTSSSTSQSTSTSSTSTSQSTSTSSTSSSTSQSTSTSSTSTSQSTSTSTSSTSSSTSTSYSTSTSTSTSSTSSSTSSTSSSTSTSTTLPPDPRTKPRGRSDPPHGRGHVPRIIPRVIVSSIRKMRGRNGS